MPKSHFEKSVDGTGGIRFEDRELMVGTGSIEGREWLSDRIEATAGRIIMGISGKTGEVRFADQSSRIGN
jgi:hypothetical protein